MSAAEHSWASDVDPRFHAYIVAAVRVHELKQGGKAHWHVSQIAKNTRNAAGDGAVFKVVACCGDQCAMLQLAVADDEADALASCDATFHVHVLASVAHHAEQSGQGGWHLSAVQKAVPRAEGGVALDLVLCSGDMCAMLNFVVGDDLSVESLPSF
jgi:hypothetical protein